MKRLINSIIFKYLPFHSGALLVVFLLSAPVYPQSIALLDDADADAPENLASVTERAPTLVGGMAELEKAIQYPPAAKKAGVEGIVYVKCIVDTDGSVDKPEIVRGKGFGLNEEALRVVSKLQFLPGWQGNRRVPFVMYLPVEFKLPRGG